MCLIDEDSEKKSKENRGHEREEKAEEGRVGTRQEMHSIIALVYQT